MTGTADHYDARQRPELVKDLLVAEFPGLEFELPAVERLPGFEISFGDEVNLEAGARVEVYEMLRHDDRGRVVPLLGRGRQVPQIGVARTSGDEGQTVRVVVTVPGQLPPFGVIGMRPRRASGMAVGR